ncbi:iojap-like protein [Gordonia bronchialis DSM 43247]|uniref:Ribosomal silencing factor RsfS n=1 Tax=Gordonia bronchialis (strain ATCC 25592 / DSM 43247 / BCRC 13721 / JCM 3198 / KCTC 3076 / NBRC 16047 / NCTC 10667) TaxID=526226 RepID=D0LC11_GORB4|nr:ribosome silencing factor [Gordonia bronchialis]ACY22398.1 iojap-like protein [Gordonia bronchialis DSM 43247]MCC3325185.1 ribosome silencing factor [Gordonia bronchialis]QGS24084.1 ribosome silencing factor [Gordonia bronchialis]
MTASAQALDMARVAAAAAEDKLAHDVTVIDVSEQLVITDLFVIASADNERQVNAIVDEIEDKLREAGHKPVRREGTREGRWALLDYIDVVVHIQHSEERAFYALERLWQDCPVVDLGSSS